MLAKISKKTFLANINFRLISPRECACVYASVPQCVLRILLRQVAKKCTVQGGGGVSGSGEGRSRSERAIGRLLCPHQKVGHAHNAMK